MDVWEPGSYLTLQPHLCCVCACPAQWASSHPLQTAVAQQPSPHQNSCTPTRCAWFILAPLPPPQTLGSAAWLASADLSSVQQLESLQKGLTELNRSQSARQGPARGVSDERSPHRGPCPVGVDLLSRLGASVHPPMG